MAEPGPSPPEMTQPRRSCVRLNCLRTGVVLFRSTMHKWSLVHLVNCSCEAEEQTADHILAPCPLHHPSNRTLSLAALDYDAVDWFKQRYSAHDETKPPQTKKNITFIYISFHFHFTYIY